ncbi:pilus assembly protein [Burkholderia multivorans]|uniref:Pilus assembly protein TadE n=1 Tax=Burkholderia multivorans TaxID=87883 RepID=A0AB37AMS4_9BURK|nr:TadE/TadG family type IV pilus assembly protein [Burkholderia multivorans]MBR7899317.1 pilus assembly protein [Burkholderia multivorans]MBR8047366.1 pilus assembly protein [Burkholderia multivorans]MCA8413353.1 pilus assembly protein [Burkholderia multivorans]MDI3303101.1 TadE/TadG family type IV pilus assembly protein [Burkholderia multivorans]PRE40496.1 pilus assembly protein TadE [Burkholderia multivorans]
MARWQEARQSCKRRRQRGVAAVEFAFVFPLFFLIFYAVVTFAMIFLIKQNLTFAASEGARAALNYTSSPCDRLKAAAATACAAVNGGNTPWGNFATVATQVAGGSTSAVNCDSSFTPSSPNSCGTAFTSSSASTFNVVVTMTYSYADKPLIPWLFIVPAPKLQSSATVQISPNML